jgi:hypothetical protein
MAVSKNEEIPDVFSEHGSKRAITWRLEMLHYLKEKTNR